MDGWDGCFPGNSKPPPLNHGVLNAGLCKPPPVTFPYQAPNKSATQAHVLITCICILHAFHLHAVHHSDPIQAQHTYKNIV
jgi:hypothetical protein